MYNFYGVCILFGLYSLILGYGFVKGYANAKSEGDVSKVGLVFRNVGISFLSLSAILLSCGIIFF